jgi:hypothetical protein
MAYKSNKSSAVNTLLEFDTDAIAKRAAEVAGESDEEILQRMATRFEILDEMTKTVKSGDVRAMIVSGPPGVGKSFSVEAILNKVALFDVMTQHKPKFEIVKGAMSSLGLYAKLYEYSDKGSVIVFDDCDSIFFDDLSLNILKAALDTSSRRWISWNTDSRLLRTEGIPDRFEFKGAVIFITNIKFSHVRSKRLKDHLDALESRCHYIDLEMDTPREKILRIRQVVAVGEMLTPYNFTAAENDEVLNFVVDNQDSMRELSLRSIIKLADLRKAFPDKWQSFAQTTLMKK